MIKGLASAVLLSGALMGVESETLLENSNFTFSLPVDGDKERTFYNYNRFRLTHHLQKAEWFATAIGDIENHWGEKTIKSASFQSADSVRADIPLSIQSGNYDYEKGVLRGKLYRLYGGYGDAKQRLTAGVQKVSMGVGRLWNPTDLFNPKNPFAYEPDEVSGVLALSYTYSMSSLSQISTVAALRSDKTLKYAGRMKGYLGVADVGVSGVEADDISMIGYEVEGEWLKSGIELRSEGGWFHDKLLQRHYFQGIVGADYGFENSLTLVGEWLHTSETLAGLAAAGLPSGSRQNLVRSHDYAGLSGGYAFDPLLYGTLTGILSIEDGSLFFSPSLRYSLDDDMTLGAGAMFYRGGETSEFGRSDPLYYLHFKVTF